MKLRKIAAVILALTMLLSITAVFSWASFDDIDSQKEAFLFGKGPEINGYSIDYRYYSPVKENDNTKYPLVIWLHGLGNGLKEGDQLDANDIAVWAKEDYQQRFKGSEGAFILAARSLEEKGLFWDNCLIYPLRGAIDAFISENRENIDISRIYIGGYSMGGKMTLKMAMAYPEMFAAIFPVCPYLTPSADACSTISSIPMWLTSGVADYVANYYSMAMTVWKNVISQSKVAEDCRFSTLTQTAYPDGSLTPTPHHSWFAVNYDMFSSDKGDYPFMKTVNGKGETVNLTYPDGMISWLSGFTSEYDGSVAYDGGNSEAYNAEESAFNVIINYFRNLIEYFLSLFR